MFDPTAVQNGEGAHCQADAAELNHDGEQGIESHDEFEDAEEEVYRPTAQEVQKRDSQREQSERASRLMGEKMLQGWAMLQDPCPNPTCNGVSLMYIDHRTLSSPSSSEKSALLFCVCTNVSLLIPSHVDVLSGSGPRPG